jgi:hypothetical protein
MPACRIEHTLTSAGYPAGMTSDRPLPARTLDDAQRQQARDLIQRLRDPKLPDDASNEPLEALERILLYPRVSDLLFWHAPELTADEVIEEALRYQPFVGWLTGHGMGTDTDRHNGMAAGPHTLWPIASKASSIWTGGRTP